MTHSPRPRSNSGSNPLSHSPMNTKTQVIEGLTRAATATRRLRPVVESNCGEDDDASYLEVALESIDAALALLRSLPSEQGDGPYWIEETTVDMLPAWGIHGPTDVDVEWFRNKEKAQDYCDALNAAFKAGRLSAELQLGKRDEYVKKVEEAYSELIMAVERKFEGETRHETALRYINERERSVVASAPDKAPKS